MSEWHKWSDGSWKDHAEDSPRARAAAATPGARAALEAAISRADAAAVRAAPDDPACEADARALCDMLLALVSVDAPQPDLEAVIGLLVSRGVKLNTPNSLSGAPALSYAATSSFNEAAVRALVNCGASLDTSVSKRGYTLLHYVRLHDGLVGLVEELIYEDTRLDEARREELLTEELVTWPTPG